MVTNTEIKKVPKSAVQHSTAGPYSPVLEVTFDTLVIISVQAPINMDGVVIGTSIEEQTKFTMENCMKQLSYAQCTLDNVFKVMYTSPTSTYGHALMRYTRRILNRHYPVAPPYKRDFCTLF